MSDTERVRIVDLPAATNLDDSMNFASDSRNGSGTRKVPYGMLKEAIQQAGGVATLAPAYDSTAIYAVGNYVMYQGALYKCSTAITTAEAWTAGHWTAASLAEDVSGLNNQLTDMHLFDRDDSDAEYTIANEVIDGHLVTTYTEVSA